jgi:hypothetical protein
MNVADALQKYRLERAAQAESFIAEIVARLSPTPADLRRLASYVNVEELRKIDDEQVIAERFAELERALLSYADRLEGIRDK